MSDLAVEEESEQEEFCPICQVPQRSLKIVFSIHINMCDVRWNELEECINGTNCDSQSIFHYRDFSHEVLAVHRENLRKRKREDEKKFASMKNMKTEKENMAECSNRSRESVDDEDDEEIFIRQPRRTPKRNSAVKTKTRTRSNKTKKKISFRRNSSEIGSSKTNSPRNTTEIDPTKKNSPENTSEIEPSTSDLNATTTEPETGILTWNSDVTIDEPKFDFTTCDGVKSEPLENPVCVITPCSSKDVTVKSECKTETQDQESDEIFSRSTSPATASDEEKQKTDKESAEKKEKCKALWNDIFKNRKDKEETPVKKSSFFGSSSDKKEKIAPHFKKMPGTGFAVDAFQYGSIPGITTYFLTHFHSDHYIGLKKSFSHPIYCSLITANLVKKKLRVQEKYLHVLELNQPFVLNRVEITCFDANHCPGAIMILFRLITGEQYLHVGDFRACIAMEEEVELQRSHITRLYLDTTYFDPQYVFPSQTDVIDRVRKIVRDVSAKHSRALFVAGSYSIGKEKVFLGILDELKCKLWAQLQKRDVFRCINDQRIMSALTDRSTEAKIHVLPMNYLRFDRLKKHLLDQSGAFTHVFAFKPTGWEMGRSTKADWINVTKSGNMTLYGVPYSEHSNFEEICRFVRFIKADKVIPTVPMKNREMYSMLKSITDSYKVSKQLSIERFMTK